MLWRRRGLNWEKLSFHLSYSLLNAFPLSRKNVPLPKGGLFSLNCCGCSSLSCSSPRSVIAKALIAVLEWNETLPRLLLNDSFLLPNTFKWFVVKRRKKGECWHMVLYYLREEEGSELQTPPLYIPIHKHITQADGPLSGWQCLLLDPGRLWKRLWWDGHWLIFITCH